MNGIDISAYQGNVNGRKIREAGIEFAIIRVTDKNNKEDTAFKENYRQCSNAGISIGVYKFSYALSKSAAAAEAEKTLELIRDKKISCGVWLDLEWEKQRQLGSKKLEEIAMTFLDTVQAAGYPCGIYCNTDWYKNVLPKSLKAYPLWLARYPAADNGTPNYSLKPGAGIIWQYTSKGKVPGISGHVDRDISWVDLNSYFKGENQESEAVYMFGVGTLQYGSGGNDVLLFQEIMKARGYYQGDLDRSYGSGCQEACRRYQKEREGAAGPVDGICGEKTWADLIAL
ncbi:GH25 family lysozyme [Ruminococcus gauvreauii]|uniref:Peptidoglycan-binding protein n=1 Tax=Ruminococcus gauvreauii TaxID=438033 RepID=A0ABY5VH70_9FIRM|nr:GH25 family lysozyme [Ruminococcus gauvreauii]UWP59255.1 peptidoglycan-binding protein [Ruminococcus gauvreauii]